VKFRRCLSRRRYGCWELERSAYWRDVAASDSCATSPSRDAGIATRLKCVGAGFK